MSVTWSDSKSTLRRRWKLIGGHHGSRYAGSGKFYKRMLHKAERQMIKREQKDLHIRKSYSKWRSEVNWRGW